MVKHHQRPPATPRQAFAGRHMLRRFLKDRSGATVVEYGIVITVLSLVIVGGISATTDSVKSLFSRTATQLDESVD